MAVPTDNELRNLLDRFVCVRMVQMWGIDLSRFQFDGSLTWAIFLMHDDGAIYGRYGSRSTLGKESAKDITVEGFKKTLRAALALDEAYRKDKKTLRKALAAKTGPRERWGTPEAIPELKSKGRFAKRFVGVRGSHGNCIHCHMIPTSEVLSLRAERKPIPDRKFWPYPMPDEVGLRMDPREVATVEAVENGSIADKAGFKVGDRIIRLKGQPILSTADIQWVLHNALDSETVAAEVERDGRRQDVQVALDAGWRLGIGEWRFLNTGLLRRVIQIGCKPVSPRQRATLGLAKKTLALRVERVPGGVARAKNIRKGDVIVAVDGKRGPMNLGAFTAYVFRENPPADLLELTLLRGGREHKVKLDTR